MKAMVKFVSKSVNYSSQMAKNAASLVDTKAYKEAWETGAKEGKDLADKHSAVIAARLQK